MKKKPTIVFLILLTFFVISFMTNILGALNPSISESFHLTETMAGFLPFSFFIAYGAMSIPSYFLLEKYGAKKMMIFAFTLSFIASIIFSTFPSFGTFLLSLFAIGSGMAALQVVINPLLRVSGGEEHFAFNSVLAQLIFGLASFISPQVYSWIVTNVNGNRNISSPFITLISSIVPEDMTWISMYWIFAITSLIMMLIIFVFVFPKVKLKEDEKVGTLENYKSLLKKKTTILFFFGIFAYVGAEQGISYWMSKYLQVYHGFDFETTGADAVANFWGYLTIGGFFGLFLLKIMDSKIVLRIFTLLAITSLTFGLFGESQTSFYSFQFCGFFLSVMFPIIVSLALNSVKDNHGAFTGILLSGIMGGAIFQIMIGFISDITSLKVGMTLVFLALGYVLSISFWAKPLIKNKVIKVSIPRIVPIPTKANQE